MLIAVSHHFCSNHADLVHAVYANAVGGRALNRAALHNMRSWRGKDVRKLVEIGPWLAAVLLESPDLEPKMPDDIVIILVRM